MRAVLTLVTIKLSNAKELGVCVLGGWECAGVGCWQFLAGFKLLPSGFTSFSVAGFYAF